MQRVAGATEVAHSPTRSGAPVAAARSSPATTLQHTLGNDAFSALVRSAGPMLQAQGSTGATAPGNVTPQGEIAHADALRADILRKAAGSVRQLEIACQKQADPSQLLQVLPDQCRSFYAWLGIGSSDPNFCQNVTLVMSDISKNLSMTLPPPYFPTSQEMADPGELCNLRDHWAVANYEGSQIRICPRMLTSEFSDVARALYLIHEMFHEPTFGMSHATEDVMNTAHCGSGAQGEALANPYCVTNVIGDLGAGVVL